MSRGFTFALLFVAAGASAQDAPPAPELEALATGVVEARDIRIDAASRNSDGAVLWTGEVAVAETPWLRLLLRTEGPPFPDGSFVALFTADDGRSDLALADLPPEGYWTDLLPNGRVRLAVVTGDGTLHPASVLVIDSLSYLGQEIASYSAHGGNQITGINDPSVPEEIRRLGRPVAYLSFLSGGRSGICTGFLVGRDLLMTNEHCINSAESCRSLSATFGYEVGVDGKLSYGRQYRCAGYDPRLTSFDLDVTVVRLKDGPGDVYGMIDPATASDDLTGPMAVIQHSGHNATRTKEVSLVDCAIAAAPVNGRAVDSDFTHTCDTAKGTSGAPVLDLAGHFRGLHHFGFRDDDSDIWTENRGVRGPLIRDWLADVLAETTLSEGGDTTQP